jgi:hypothetical protein
MENIDKYDELLKLLTEKVTIEGKDYLLKDDFYKFFIKNNKSAGIRIRKTMQMVRELSKDIRDSIQEHKKTI